MLGVVDDLHQVEPAAYEPARVGHRQPAADEHVRAGRGDLVVVGGLDVERVQTRPQPGDGIAASPAATLAVTSAARFVRAARRRSAVARAPWW